MTEPQEFKTHSIQIDREAYFAKLSEIDRENLTHISQLFISAMAKRELHGIMCAVGGGVLQEGPRKDVDITLDIQREPDKEPAQAYEEALRGMLSDKPNFRIEVIEQPKVDHEFGDDFPIEAEEFRVQVSSANNGTPIEFIGSGTLSKTVNRKDIKQILFRKSQSGKPFVVLADTTSPNSLTPEILEDEKLFNWWLNGCVIQPFKGMRDPLEDTKVQLRNIRNDFKDQMLPDKLVEFIVSFIPSDSG